MPAPRKTIGKIEKGITRARKERRETDLPSDLPDGLLSSYHSVIEEITDDPLEQLKYIIRLYAVVQMHDAFRAASFARKESSMLIRYFLGGILIGLSSSLAIYSLGLFF
jgi:hypothetical protein